MGERFSWDPIRSYLYYRLHKVSHKFLKRLAKQNFITMDYQPVFVKTHRRPPGSTHSAESRYWRQFKHPVFVKEYAPITSVHFSPSRPHRYAVTAATRVQIYAPRTQKLTKTISRFKDVARSGCIREDGKLVVAGDDSGLIQVCKYMHLRNCVLFTC